MRDGNYYETNRALAEYLLFHYGDPKDLLPPDCELHAALNFHARCVAQCFDTKRLPGRARALDLGCAVGRSAFELARHCADVVAIDYSERFITIAGHLRKNGSFLFGCVDEGDLTHPCQAVVPTEIDRSRVHFQRGDAQDLPVDLGKFDAILMANLLDRLNDPRRCLRQSPALLNPGGQLVITSPYTWLADYTPKGNWLGGFEHGGKRQQTLDALKAALAEHFEFQRRLDLPFLIREHARKFQLCISEASIWIRK